MKKYFEPVYWIVATVAMSLVFRSLTGSFGEALFLSLALLPGILLAKYLSGDISFRNRKEGITRTVYLILIVLSTEYLAIILVNLSLQLLIAREDTDILLNPAFILLAVAAALSMEKLLKIKFFPPGEPGNRYIKFTSERSMVSLDADSITYIESRDYQVLVNTVSGKAYPTRMKISQWEAVLDSRFIRIHRAFIVNKKHVAQFDSKVVCIGEMPLEISRKYKERALEKLGK